jgi:hypothetical protein
MLSEASIVAPLNTFAVLIGLQPAACGSQILSSNDNTRRLVLIYNSDKTEPPIFPNRVSSTPDPPRKPPT